jgi:hypothetical protein
MKSTARLIPIFAIALGLSAVTPASAAERPAGGIFGALAPLDAHDLSVARGTNIPIDFDAAMNATLTGNTVNGAALASYGGGSNFISSSAFSGASGVAVVVQNTGNNVIIQTATMVNVNFH